jgi:hypothetical protein
MLFSLDLNEHLTNKESIAALRYQVLDIAVIQVKSMV